MARSKDKSPDGFQGLFKGLSSLFDLVSSMTEEGKEEYSRSGQATDASGKVRGVYGFSIRVGLGGKPIVEQFGNIKKSEKGAEIAEVREPVVDVFDEGDTLLVIAELPGVNEKDIKVEAKVNIMELTAGTKDRKYSKDLLLPCEVEAAPIKSSYRNGVLEIKLTKKK
ncbi:MAG: Hsp20/alpha crystallin family protein [Chloroflexi bacterium]|nr:Hsp20/alpha crystallin family protein [Chloroflexota bacterium]